jgi:cholest-4-en-3-one 26-monooxygenase
VTASVDAQGRPRCPIDLDVVDPDTFAQGVPLDAFATVRETRPVYWQEQETHWDEGFWVVTRYDDIQQVSRTPEVFSSYERGSLLNINNGMDAESALAMTRMLMLNMDPPEHSAYRNIVQRAFTPRTIRNLEPRLEQFANEIVDRALAKGEGDFVKDVAAELPLLAICELVGVPPEERDQIFELSNRLVGGDDPEFRREPEEAQLAMTEMYLFADRIAAARQECPADDVATRLLEASVEGTALTQEQFDIFFMLLMVAGNETTRNAITHGMQAFFEHPDQWSLFKSERPLESATEEIIRWATPVMQFQRTAMADTSLGGQPIKAGERVAIYYSSGNRDSSALVDPDTFDITRRDNEHLAFGGGGPHFCLGANLARAEIRILFDVLADRAPDIAPLGPPRALRSNFLHAIKELPVRYAAMRR